MRNLNLILLALACGALIALGSACGGGPSFGRPAGGDAPLPEPPGAGGAMPRLPAPNELLQGKSTSAEDYNRWLEGDDYHPFLPYSNIDGPGIGTKKHSGGAERQASAYSFGELPFMPSWEPGVSTTSADLAYAVFPFNGLATYTGPARLTTNWKDAYPAGVWIALANFDTNRWDWYEAQQAAVEPDSLDPYIAADGRLFATVLLLGKEPATLRWILVGDPIEPVAYLSSDMPSDPLQRVALLTVTFDTSGCLTVGSEITQLEIDFDGDGTYDESGLVDSFTHIYTHGDYTARLRVTDNLGQIGTDDMSFHVINTANLFPTASFNPIISTPTAPATINFDASASNDPDGSIKKYQWDFDNDGDTDYTSTEPTATYTFSMEGANNVALTVTDSDFATDTAYGQVICNNGWRDSTLMTGVTLMTEKITGVVQGTGMNARACVAFKDHTHSLVFMRGSSSIGLGWDAPVTVAAGNINLQQGLSPSMVIESLTQTPCIAYGVDGPNDAASSLSFIRSSNAGGTSWGAAVAVAPGEYSGHDNFLAQFGGMLTIANVQNAGHQGTGKVRVFQATDAVGNTWNTGLEIASSQGAEQLSRVRMLDIPGQSPLLVWTKTLGNDFNFAGSVATAMDGSAWNAPFSLASSGIQQREAWLGMAGGTPAICYGSNNSGSALYFSRADNAAGSAWTAAPQLLQDTGWTGGFCTMATVDGKPAIAYFEQTSYSLRYITAVDAAGSAWNAPMVVDSIGEPGMNLTLLCLPNNVPIVVYYDPVSDQIRSSVFF